MYATEAKGRRRSKDAKPKLILNKWKNSFLKYKITNAPDLTFLMKHPLIINYGSDNYFCKAKIEIYVVNVVNKFLQYFFAEIFAGNAKCP